MRVTYVIQRYGREVIGGGESFCRSFASRLAARGHEVSVVTGRALETTTWADHYGEGSEDVDGVTVHRLPTYPTADPLVIETLAQLASGNTHGPVELHYAWQRAQGPLLHTLNHWLTTQRDKIDVLIPVTQYYFPATEALLMSKRLELPTLFHPLAHDEPSLNMELFAKTFALATTFGFLTEEEETLVRNRFGSHQPGLVHGVGVDLDAPVDETALSALSLPTIPYLCYVGRCAPYKLSDAVDFVRRFRATHGNVVELVIVGEPQDWLQPQPGIRLVGFLPDPVRNAVLRRSLALLMPSPFESFSMVLTEGWALARPALVNGKCGALRGQATRSNGAIAYDDYGQFEAGLLELLNNPELANRMGRAGRGYVAERYEWSHVMDGYEAILDRAAGPNVRRASSASASASSSRRSGDPRSRAAAERVVRNTRADAYRRASNTGPNNTVASDAQPNPNQATIRWEGAIFKHHSLSEVNRQLISALVKMDEGDQGVGDRHLEIGPQREGIDIAPSGRLMQLARTESSAPSPSVELTIRHQWPPDLSAVANGELVVMQLWEFGCVPQAWVDALDRVAEFWVSSEWLRGCYLASGVPASRVVTIPLGVDLERFTPQGDTLDLPTNKTTKLLFVGGTITRKGIDVLLGAYVKAFRSDDDVCLVIKGFGSGGVYAGSSIREVVDAVNAAPGTPEIVYLDQDLTPQQMAALYRSCDVLVHPYRGEGFGLTVAEAMACGLTVVTTAGGPTDEFCPADVVYRIPAAVTPIAIGALGLPLAAGPMWWLEPDLDALKTILMRVVAEPDELANLGKRGAEHARTLNWDAAAKLVAARIQALTNGSRSFDPVIEPVLRPRHRGAPGCAEPVPAVAVVVSVTDDVDAAMDLLVQLEGDTIDGAPFTLLLDASAAEAGGAGVVEQLQQHTLIADADDAVTARDLAAALTDAGFTHVVRLVPGARLSAGWWTLLAHTLSAYPVVEVLGAHGRVQAITVEHLAKAAPDMTFIRVLVDAERIQVPNGLVAGPRSTSTPALPADVALSLAR